MSNKGPLNDTEEACSIQTHITFLFALPRLSRFSVERQPENTVELHLRYGVSLTNRLKENLLGNDNHFTTGSLNGDEIFDYVISTVFNLCTPVYIYHKRKFKIVWWKTKFITTSNKHFHEIHSSAILKYWSEIIAT